MLASDGAVRWRGEVVGKLVAGDSVLKPRVTALADEHLSSPAREKIDKRLNLWIAARVEKLLGPLFALENPTDLAGVARGIAYQASEALGVLDRARVAQDMKTLDQESRAKLRALGLRFGAYHIYLPALLKPAPRALATQLYALKHGGSELVGLDTILQFASSGRTSFPADPEASESALSRGGVQALRQAGGPGRHPRKARRSHSARRAIQARPHSRNAACRHGGWRRLRGHGTDDVACGLRRRGLLDDPDFARLCGDEAPRPRHHGAARSAAQT